MLLQSYCTNCLTVTEHKTSLDNGGDIVLNCTNVVEEIPCTRFWKLPARNAEGKMQTPEEVRALIDLHYESNKDQVPAHTLYA